jgi:hypothetical protein
MDCELHLPSVPILQSLHATLFFKFPSPFILQSNTYKNLTNPHIIIIMT